MKRGVSFRSGLFCLFFSISAAASVVAGAVPGEDATPEEEVRWLVEENVVVDVFDTAADAAQARIVEKMDENPELYFELLRRYVVDQPYDHRTWGALGKLHLLSAESYRDETRRLYRAVLSGDLHGDIEPRQSASLLSYAASTFADLAQAEDIPLLLELVDHPNSSVSLAALKTLSKIADPSIIPALEELNPEWFAEPRTQELFIEPIRERYPEWNGEGAQAPEIEGNSSPPAVGETPDEDNSTKYADKTESDSVDAEESRGGWGLWALGGALVLGAAVYAIAKGHSTG